MLLAIDMQSETPIYTQIAQQIIEGIAKGELIPGEGLPSVRALAVDLGVNLHTVNKAYHLLKQDGYVQINRKQGVIIEPDALPIADEQFKKNLLERLRPLVAEAVARGMEIDQFEQLVGITFKEMLPNGS
ncbi:MAG: GntR family transcriptional regulator [Candidatus Pristimantibacillus lignocellulolyticus]|uniref:GntR family transcriptional regulator n=1 Tax=Candidatus Pristimantibacillus lignocellulolyticus TaxID=2994561 RepID=A0A9J6ZG16_9BACL|nr:MAG: GntR family transcriptional regulator [Candidatus Pristimantibacillus lignocellulolyticus]